MRSFPSRAASALLTLTISGAMALVATAPAQAADRDGVCESGEFCFNYNSDLGGSWSDHRASVGDYGTTTPSCYVFKSSGAGRGLCIKNRAGGFWNRSGKSVRVYYNSNYGGSYATLANGAKGKLPSPVYNNNASHRFLTTTTTTSAWASPVPASAVITARWYYPKGGFHGAIDYAGFTGKFKSACTGKIDQISINSTYANRNAYQVSGSTNYLWVNCGNGIRMGYAHWYAKDKPSSMVVGTAVKAGQDLLPVGNQGNSSATHLHFEVRQNGTQIDGHNFLKSKGVTGLPKG